MKTARPARAATIGALAAGATGFAAGALAERRLVRRRGAAAATPARRCRPCEAPASRPSRATTGCALPCGRAVRLDAALTLVFVHGYTVTSECWAAQVRDLSGDSRPGGLRIVLYDQRGHGASGSGEAAQQHDRAARPRPDEVLRQQVPDGPVVLAGHSMGGMTIMALAEQRPELFGSKIVAVALVDTSSGGMAQVTLGLPAALATVPARLIPYATASRAVAAPGRTLPRGRLRPRRWVNARVAFGKDASGAARRAMTTMQAPMHLETMATFLPTFADPRPHGRTRAAEERSRR